MPETTDAPLSNQEFAQTQVRSDTWAKITGRHEAAEIRIHGICPTCHGTQIAPVQDLDGRYWCFDCEAQWTGVRVPLVPLYHPNSDPPRPSTGLRVGRTCELVECNLEQHIAVRKTIDRSVPVAYDLIKP